MIARLIAWAKEIPARVRFAWGLFRAGLYQKRGLFMAAISTFCGLSVLVALTPDMLPRQLLPFHAGLVDLGKYATGVGFIAGMVGFQSKRPLPKLPLPKLPTSSAPSLLDDERGA